MKMPRTRGTRGSCCVGVRLCAVCVPDGRPKIHRRTRRVNAHSCCGRSDNAAHSSSENCASVKMGSRAAQPLLPATEARGVKTAGGGSAAACGGEAVGRGKQLISRSSAVRRTSVSPCCSATTSARSTVPCASGQNSSRVTCTTLSDCVARGAFACGGLAHEKREEPSGRCDDDEDAPSTSRGGIAGGWGKRAAMYKSAWWRTAALWSRRPHTARMNGSTPVLSASLSSRRSARR
mmetsp:Transcript_53482/g.94363  ORF Transcript_53482/g.94363 Transcript_53482/m.94363 type:complete len:235 (+) Transcript_53482:338-1042(+)